MNEILNLKISNPSSPAKEKTIDVKPRTREKVNILWTGGFDSTFRIMQLSKLNIDIQPYYIYDKRKSETFELNAIKAITADIVTHPETKAAILPLLRVKSSDIEPDASLTEAYNKLSKSYSIGIQYDWLGRFSKIVPGIELVMEKGLSSKLYNCVMNNSRLLTIENDYTSYCIADKEKSDPDFIKVFGNFRFPHQILHLTKREIAELYKDMGFEQTLSKTWFCHNPINNEPCGVCNPCKSVVEEGLSFRLNKKALKRYTLLQKYGNYRWLQYYLKAERLITRTLL